MVEAIGAQGHGIARVGGGKLFIPYTLPGETVLFERAGGRAHVVAIEYPSAERAAPICRHFGACGGCMLQHWSGEPYRAWKEGLVTSALERAGLAFPSIEPLKTYPVSSRRRATFAALRTASGMQFGYRAQRTHRIVDLEECPILVPAIADAVPKLKSALIPALRTGDEAKVHVTAAANGLDCTIEAKAEPLGAASTLTASLLGAGFIRFIWNGLPLFLATKPNVSCGGVIVPLPPGGFVQAVEACERDISRWILAAIEHGRRAKPGPFCDLFAGLGAFSFPLAELGPVKAFEENASAVESLSAAAKSAKGRKPVTAIRRDLYRNPLGPLELNTFAAIILDPPREGAEAQVWAIAASKVETAIMISCNPITFARDAAILAGAGFALARLAAFDQFRFSAHVEIAALFARPAKRAEPRPPFRKP